VGTTAAARNPAKRNRDAIRLAFPFDPLSFAKVRSLFVPVLGKVSRIEIFIEFALSGRTLRLFVTLTCKSQAFNVHPIRIR
jgi:hypothetical protein